MNKFRTHNCSELNEKDIDKNVTISGWLHRRRDHGNLIFITDSGFVFSKREKKLLSFSITHCVKP